MIVIKDFQSVFGIDQDDTRSTDSFLIIVLDTTDLIHKNMEVVRHTKDKNNYMAKKEIHGVIALKEFQSTSNIKKDKQESTDSFLMIIKDMAVLTHKYIIDQINTKAKINEIDKKEFLSQHGINSERAIKADSFLMIFQLTTALTHAYWPEKKKTEDKSKEIGMKVFQNDRGVYSDCRKSTDSFILILQGSTASKHKRIPTNERKLWFSRRDSRTRTRWRE